MASETVTTFDVIDQLISEAWTELLGARADWEHSPNSDTLQTVEYAEARMNKLVDRAVARMTRAELDAALARPLRRR